MIGSILVLAAALFVYASSSAVHEKMQYTVLEYKEPALPTDSVLSVMTFNLGYLSGMINNLPIKGTTAFFDGNLQNAKTLVSTLKPTILGLQEVDFASRRSFYQNQLDTLASAAGFGFAYRSINWDKRYVPFPYWPPSRHFGRMLSGQAIGTAVPIENVSTITLTPHLNAPAYYRAFYLDRLLQVAEVKFREERILMMNVHLEAFDRETRLDQIIVIKELFERHASEQPVLLFGDFNCEVPGREDEKDALSLLMDAPFISSAVPFDKASSNGTFPSSQPDRMIDYIFYNANFLTCTSAKVLEEAGQISDHLPVYASFILK